MWWTQDQLPSTPSMGHFPSLRQASWSLCQTDNNTCHSFRTSPQPHHTKASSIWQISVRFSRWAYNRNVFVQRLSLLPALGRLWSMFMFDAFDSSFAFDSINQTIKLRGLVTIWGFHAKCSRTVLYPIFNATFYFLWCQNSDNIATFHVLLCRFLL